MGGTKVKEKKSSLHFQLAQGGQYCKTFNGRNLQVFAIIKRVFPFPV